MGVLFRYKGKIRFYKMRAKTWVITAGLIVASGAMSLSSGDDGKSSDKGDREKARIWESLSEEQRGQLREALREVWSDPAVISAREEVKQASDAYQAAIHDAVKSADPDVAELVVKLQAANEGEFRERIGGGAQPKFGLRRSGDYPMGPPGYLDKLTDEEKERFRKAQEKARESEAVMAAKEELEALRGEDAGLRQRRLLAHRKLRKAMMESMAEIDPEIKPLQMRVYEGEGLRRPGTERSRKKGE